MDQRGLWMLFLLYFCPKAMSEPVRITAQQGDKVTIQCSPPVTGALVSWFRVVEKTGVEFIASLRAQTVSTDTSTFRSSFSTGKQNELVLNSFDAMRDSGFYSCASLNKNMLQFGQVTHLVAPDPPTKAPTTTTKSARLTETTTTSACLCNAKTPRVQPTIFMMCDPVMLAPLAGGCCLLLLLLIITICYCNRIRTRRCPHHGRQRKIPPGKPDAKPTRQM